MAIKGILMLKLPSLEDSIPPLPYYTPHAGVSKKALELGLGLDSNSAVSKHILASSRDKRGSK
jgi:hypothetical protein